MKATVVSLISLLFICLFLQCQTAENSSSKVEIFKQQDTARLTNWIILRKDGNLVSGTFYGVRYTKDKKPVFFRSQMENIEMTNEKLNFKLDIYTFSTQAYESGKFEEGILSAEPEYSDLPVILQLPLLYYGRHSGNTIRFGEKSLIYGDNHSENFIFEEQSQ